MAICRQLLGTCAAAATECASAHPLSGCRLVDLSIMDDSLLVDRETCARTVISLIVRVTGMYSHNLRPLILFVNS